MMVRMHMHVRVVCNAPFIAHRGFGWEIPKGLNDARLVTGLDFHFGALFQDLAHRKQEPPSPSYWRGFTPQHQREDPIAASAATSRRLRAAGQSHVRSYHDATNAFAFASA